MQAQLSPKVCLFLSWHIERLADTDWKPRCLPDSDPECPICARQHSVIRELRRNQLRLADRHDLFLEEVHQAEDGFNVVADAFGRGLFGREGVDEKIEA